MVSFLCHAGHLSSRGRAARSGAEASHREAARERYESKEADAFESDSSEVFSRRAQCPGRNAEMFMTRLQRAAVLLSVALLCAPIYNVRAQDWVLVWSDEFDGDSLDMSKWSYQYGTGTSEGLVSWGNNELQYYTDRPENIYVATESSTSSHGRSRI
jgi:hypothetical protein